MQAQAELPALAGGSPIRDSMLPYGHHLVDDRDATAIVNTLYSGVLTGGRAVTQFEEVLARRCGVRYAVACSSGTAALQLALRAVGVTPKSSVIVPPLSFVATANAVVIVGAEPLFADVSSDRCLDHTAAAHAVTPSTSAVITVDYAGVPSDVTALRGRLPSGMPIVVDAAHSLGALIRGTPAAAQGDVTTLSFHPVKHITTGEGGAALTDDANLAERMRRLRNHGMTSSAGERLGSSWRYDVTELGDNHRLTDLQAALGIAQLTRLDAWLARRLALANQYNDLLGNIPGVTLPPRPHGRDSAWHLYPIEVGDEFGLGRDTVIDGLRAENIAATLHYPPIHLLSAYRERGHVAGETPLAEALCSRLVTLPLFPAMSRSDQDNVAEALTRLRRWAVGATV